MGPLSIAARNAGRSVFPILLLVNTLALATNPGFASSPISETIQAAYSQAGNTVGITLIVYNYSTSADLQVLSTAFQKGQDRELATALSRTKAAGHCTITGTLSNDVAFIRVVSTPTGRQITFITSRPSPLDGTDPSAPSQSFDLEVGQFDLNDADPGKSTGFLFPASKLVIDAQGEFHYDLTGTPLALVDVVDLSGTQPVIESRAVSLPLPTAP